MKIKTNRTCVLGGVACYRLQIGMREASGVIFLPISSSRWWLCRYIHLYKFINSYNYVYQPFIKDICQLWKFCIFL